MLEMVRQFYAEKHKGGGSPNVNEAGTFVREEIVEWYYQFHEALGVPLEAAPNDPASDVDFTSLTHDERVKDFKEVLDNIWCFLHYADVQGYDVEEGFRRLFQSNMTKPVVWTGKIPKGVNYVPPVLADLV